MAAEQYRQAVRVAAGTTGEHVAHRVHPHGEASGLAIGAKMVAALAVDIGERQTADPALRRGAEPGHIHQAIPKPFTVNPLVGLRHALLL